MNYQSIDYEKLQSIVKEAGKLLMHFYTDSYAIHIKRDRSISTDADVASEQFLLRELIKLFPTQIWGEESGKHGQKSDYFWIIDPLDGTRNFSRRLPYFCISVALTYKQEPVVAVVYQPVTDELFFATKELSATCNGTSIHATEKSNLKDTVIGITSWGQLKEEQVMNMLKKRAVVRRHGAIALDLAYVAAGRLDAFFYVRAFWWDIAAGRLLVEKAGGIVTPMGSIAKNGAVSGGVAAGNKLFDEITPLINAY